MVKPPDIAIPITWVAIETGARRGGLPAAAQAGDPGAQQVSGLAGRQCRGHRGWSRLFFGSRNLAVSTVAAAAMIGTGAEYVAQARRADGVAAAAGVPLTAWVAFATVLTASLWRKNR